MPRHHKGWLNYLGFLLPIRGLFDGVFETYYPVFFIRVLEIFTGNLDQYTEHPYLGLFDYLLVFPAIIRCYIHYGVSWNPNDEYGLVRDLIHYARIGLMAILLPIPLSAFLYFYWLPVTIGLLALAATQLMIMTYIYCKESFSRPPPAQREFMMLSAMRTMYQYLRPAPPAPLLEPGVKVDVYGKLDHYAFMIGLHLEKPPKRIPSLQAKLPNGRAVVFSAVEIKQALETGEFKQHEWQALLQARHVQQQQQQQKEKNPDMPETEEILKQKLAPSQATEAIDLSQPAKRVVLPANYKNYRCPISQMIMSNPTELNCGHIFEQTEIKRWRGSYDQARAEVDDYDELRDIQIDPQDYECCPMCREPIHRLTLNQALKEEITAFLYTVRREWDPLTQAILTEEEIPGWETFKENTNIFLQEGNAETLLKKRFVDAIRNFVIVPLLEKTKAAAEQSPDPYLCRNTFGC